MENNKQNKNSQAQQNDKFWDAVEIPFTESKEDLWLQLESKIDFEKTHTKVIKLNWLKYASAAIIVLFLSTSFFARFYTETISTKYGETKMHELPDGSKILLNVDSKLSYTPYWFNINRSLSFEGEAFFEVMKGKKFIVNSPFGTTEVLGTSFNVLSRDNNYKVFCKTGLVKVTNVNTSENVLLHPNQMASLEINTLKFTDNVKVKEQLAWQFGDFYFQETPLQNVLSALEKEYNINVNTNFSLKRDYLYTGFFRKHKNALDALQTVCLSFDLKVQKINEKEYSVSNTY
ncbi:MAG: transmembrane sensor [Planctomycetota bacterium]|jgi:transmembrane sensor